MKKLTQAAGERLLRRRKTLLGLYGRSAAAEQALRENIEPDWPDRAADLESASLLQTLTERERRELEEIDQALARIQAGTYGSCVRCQRAIGRQRLLAVPEAELCLECVDDRPRLAM